MPVLNRSADRFQRALEGERVDDPGVVTLLETSRRLGATGPRTPGPDPDFVAALRVRLMAEADTLPAPTAAAARAATARRAATRVTPVVVVVGRGLPRALAGAAASALLVGAVVGAASRSAVPGESLYPVKGWLDGVAVRLSTSDYERGTTYLGQAQEHISDSRALAARSEPDSRDIDTALGAAAESVLGGQRALDRDYARTGNPQALLALRDFTTRAIPQVEALRTEVPPASLPALGRLESLLRESQVTTSRRIAACGSQCGEALTTGLGPASLPDVTTSSTSATSGAPRPGTASVPATAGGGITVPDAPVTGGAGGGGAGAGVGGSTPTPSVTAGTSGATIGAGGVGATLSTGGATATLPTISATVPVPSGTVSVPLPSATVGTGGVTATVPGSTLGPVTLPGATIKLP
ncbi:hypothetical protein GCM10009867_15390 [Pedococcus aerophilus]|uniref:DUF5667 domain-containing protein n=1 Tax=Pedococcus aerophilus TaxID=436356 RepID=A0ABP6H310_9MICO